MGKGLVGTAFPQPTRRLFSCRSQSQQPWPADKQFGIGRYEVIGPQVFRFEYCYLLTDGTLSITPPTNVSGIAAIIADIAVIDSKSKVLLNDAQIAKFSRAMIDYRQHVPGELRVRLAEPLDGNELQSQRFRYSAIRTPQISISRSTAAAGGFRCIFGCTNVFFTSLRLFHDYSMKNFLHSR